MSSAFVSGSGKEPQRLSSVSIELPAEMRRVQVIRSREESQSKVSQSVTDPADNATQVGAVAQRIETLPFDWMEACKVSAELRSAFQTVVLAQTRYEEDFDEATPAGLISDLVAVRKRLNAMCGPPSRIRALIDTLNRILVVRGLQGAELRTKYVDRNNEQRVYREPRYLCWHEAALKACQRFLAFVLGKLASEYRKASASELDLDAFDFEGKVLAEHHAPIADMLRKWRFEEPDEIDRGLRGELVLLEQVLVRQASVTRAIRQEQAKGVPQNGAGRTGTERQAIPAAAGGSVDASQPPDAAPAEGTQHKPTDDGGRQTGSAGALQDRDAVRDLVFISYSHKDNQGRKKWLDDLRTHLTPYLRQGLIEAWSDLEIKAGSKWSADIETAIARTRVAVLLVTPHFLASDFIHDHELCPLLKLAENAGVQILWIPVRASSYHLYPLEDTQALIPPDKPLAEMKAERDEAWVRICKQIAAAASC